VTHITAHQPLPWGVYSPWDQLMLVIFSIPYIIIHLYFAVKRVGVGVKCFVTQTI
jgi:hypothetical protein